MPVSSSTGKAHVTSIQRKSKSEQKGFIGVAGVGAAEGDACRRRPLKDDVQNVLSGTILEITVCLRRPSSVWQGAPSAASNILQVFWFSGSGVALVAPAP